MSSVDATDEKVKAEEVAVETVSVDEAVSAKETAVAEETVSAVEPVSAEEKETVTEEEAFDVNLSDDDDDDKEPVVAVKSFSEADSLARYIDHTALKPTTTKVQIEKLCDEAMKHKFRSICVNPYWVQHCAELTADSEHVKVCTVIGFPLGSTTTFAKCCEAAEAVLNGADELDMVLNIGLAKDHEWDKVQFDVKSVVQTAHQFKRLMKAGLGKKQLLQWMGTVTSDALNGEYADAPLLSDDEICVKVIFETCLLTEDEIVKSCQCVVRAGANFVKTSTGFSTGGATTRHISLMRLTVDDESVKLGREKGTVHVKASGGIRDAATAQEMVKAGADRIGASAGVKIVSAAAGGAAVAPIKGDDDTY